MSNIRENKRFNMKKEIKNSIFESDYTHEELSCELETIYQNWNFLSFKEWMDLVRKNTEKIIKIQNMKNKYLL